MPDLYSIRGPAGSEYARARAVIADAFEGLRQGSVDPDTFAEAVMARLAHLDPAMLVVTLEDPKAMGPEGQVPTLCEQCGRETTDWEEAPALEGGQVAGPWCQGCLEAYARGRAAPAMPVSLVEVERDHDECEVCDGQFGIVPIATVTFIADDTGMVTPVRMCRECLTVVFRAMNQQWSDAAEASTAAVEEICRQLGVPFAATPFPEPGDD